jgi:hypothetical protein
MLNNYMYLRCYEDLSVYDRVYHRHFKRRAEEEQKQMFREGSRITQRENNTPFLGLILIRLDAVLLRLLV